MNIKLSPKAVSDLFTTIVTLLVTAHILQAALYHLAGFDYSRYLDLDTENNLPTFYSSMALEFSAILLFLIYWQKKQLYRKESFYWLGLALIFAFLGFDETAQVHEEVSDFFTLIVEASGVLYFPWIIPYGLATGLIALVYWPWLIQLPRETQKNFVIAGLVFLSGAIGMEMIGAYHADLYDVYDWRYTISYTFEETLEMLGIVLFIRALMDYISQNIQQITVSFTQHNVDTD
jgi:hypothetical protein